MNLYPLHPPSTPGQPFAPDVGPYLQQLIEDGSWANYIGAALEQLSTAVKDYTGCDSLLCSSGSIAVELALRACKIQSGDEVLLAGYDYPGNFRCIEAVGAMAVVVDLAPKSWSIDLNELQAAITPQTKAIIVSHLHGEIQDLIAIREMADRHGIIVIEDACQAMGGRLAGMALGSLWHIGIWSFGGSKLLTAGRGGAVLCNEAALMQRARVASQRSNDAMALSQLQAAVLIPQMQCLAEATRRRYENARSFVAALQTSDWCEPVCVDHALANTTSAFYKLGVVIRDGGVNRDRFLQTVASRGAEIGPGFRGFASRSHQRCRRMSELVHSRNAGARTLLIHHRHLTAQPGELQRFASELNAIAAECV
jgi:perosamine synthetase